MEASSERIKTLIYLESFTCSDVLINSVRTYFIISIVLDNSILPVLKFIMLFVTLVTEIPSGYFSNKYGDKLALILDWEKWKFKKAADYSLSAFSMTSCMALRNISD